MVNSTGNFDVSLVRGRQSKLVNQPALLLLLCLLVVWRSARSFLFLLLLLFFLLLLLLLLVLLLLILGICLLSVAFEVEVLYLYLSHFSIFPSFNCWTA